jgi:mannose-6-phosphate isomerase-like protein (cupin superfamily)
MVLAVGESTGGPTNAHEASDQWLFVIDGKGEATVDGRTASLISGSLLLIEAQETHEIVNTGPSPLVTLSIYAPPEY